MRLESKNVTPTLPEAIQTMIDANLIKMRFCMPAKIVSYDASTQYATVQPQLMTMYEGASSALALPSIPNVPVKHPRAQGGKTYVHMPLAEGDDVTLIISDRSLDNWKTQGGMTNPNDRRKFNMTDAIALIGGSSEPDAFEVNDPESIEITNQSGVVQIKPDGTINIGDYDPSKSAALGEAVQARLMAIEEFITSFLVEYDAHVHPTAAPGPPSPPAVPADPFTPDTSVVSSETVKVTP